MPLVLFIYYRLSFDVRHYQRMIHFIPHVFLGAYLFSTTYSKKVFSHRQPISLHHPLWSLMLPVVISQTFFAQHPFLCRNGTRLKSMLHKQRSRLRGPIVRMTPFYSKSLLKPRRNWRGTCPSSNWETWSYPQPYAHSSGPKWLLSQRKNDTG